MTLYTYYLCNEKNEKLIKFKARICPQGIIVYKNDDIEILTELDKLPSNIQKVLKNDKSDSNKVNALEYYMSDFIIPPIKTGPYLDEFIQQKLGYSKKILQNGRLDSLWSIYILLTNHFVLKENEKGFYITPQKNHSICFSRRLIGADKIFISKTVQWADVKGACVCT